MNTEREQIAREQRMKAEHIGELNNWLEEEGYDFEVINYSACGFEGTKGDNEKAVRTIKFFAERLPERIKREVLI